MENRYEVLDQLPTHGPMYIPVAENGKKFYSEGYVVKFTKSDGSTWVANFKLGWANCCYTREYKTGKVLVIANGMGYLMNPDSEIPEKTFGISIREVIPIDDEQLIFADDTKIELFDGSGIVWTSPRISWDGIRNLELNDSFLTGESYDPVNDADTWIDFRVNLVTKEIEGGSYRQHFTDDGQPIKKKSWWKVWN